MGICTGNAMINRAGINWPDKHVQVHVNPRITVDTFHYDLDFPLGGSNSCFVRELDMSINIAPAGGFECIATLTLNMNRRGCFSIPLLILLSKKGMFGIQLGLGYLLHASYSHNACIGQGPLNPGSFCRGGGQFRSRCDGLTS